MKPCSASVTPRGEPLAAVSQVKQLSHCRTRRSVETGPAVAGPLQLEEAVSLGHQCQPVPQPSGRFSLGGWRDDGAEQRPAAYPDDRRSDVKPDLVERLVM